MYIIWFKSYVLLASFCASFSGPRFKVGSSSFALRKIAAAPLTSPDLAKSLSASMKLGCMGRFGQDLVVWLLNRESGLQQPLPNEVDIVAICQFRPLYFDMTTHPG